MKADDSVPFSKSQSPAARHSLAAARPAILFLAGVSLLVALISFAMFAYQWNYRLPSGVLLRDADLGLLQVLGHALRAGVCGTVGVLLLGYAQALRAADRVTSSDEPLLIGTHNRLWNGMAICVGLLVAFSILLFAYSLYLVTSR